ncbi:hypothetical protein [Variovorax boronicumulans]|uniref:hypothetical protein n=1 Tax=Variovorax boronicumulans TaxID=436515 RepID=UPI00278B2408|nr:hypothetical protein [Variovorax boronicumulans]MDQ0045447.1 hypothetical protein [Variovorax boronicumulans]
MDVVFSPAIAQIVLAAGDGSMPAPGMQKLTARLAGAKVAGLYVFVTNADVLFPARQQLFDGGSGIYTNTAPIAFNRTLTAGTYKGNLQLQVCSDQNCSTEYGVNGRNLPYEITVLPAPKISASVNGKPLTSSTQTVALKAGDTVDLQSDMPVTWSTGSGGVTISGESHTSTSWHAVLGYGMSDHGLTGTMYVNAITVFDPDNPEKPQANTRVSFTLTE